MFKFSPLSLIKTNQKELPDSIILNLNGNLCYKGEAIREILENLNFFGRVLSLLAKITPLYLLSFFTRLLLKKEFGLGKIKVNAL